MLYVNDEPLKSGSKQKERFERFMKEKLPLFKNPVVFKSTDPVRFNTSGVVERARIKTLPLEATIAGDEGTETWVYTPRPPVKRGDRLVYSGKSRQLTRSWMLDKKKDAEVIFMLMEVLPYIDRRVIELVDKKRSATQKLQKENKELTARFIVQSDDSPISKVTTGGEDTMRMVASAWGVDQADDVSGKSYEEVVVELWDAIQGQEKNRSSDRGYDSFLDEVRADEIIRLRANIRRAVEQDKISYDNKNFCWRFVSNNYSIMTVTASQVSDPETALYNFLLKNVKSRNAFYFHIGQEPDGEEPEDGKRFTLNKSVEKEDRGLASDLNVMHFGKLKTVAAKMDINTHQKNKPTLIREILNKDPARCKELVEEVSQG